MKSKELTLCAMMCVLYVIGSKMVIPAGIIPLTLQTMMIIIAGILLQPKQILASYGLYLGMGLLGFPVFANGGGLGYVLQPSFGFLIGFFIAALFISFIKRSYHIHSMRKIVPVCMIALFLIYIIGCMYMYGIFHLYLGIDKSMQAVIAIGALPFLISDMLSILVGSFIALRLSSISIIQHACSIK